MNIHQKGIFWSGTSGIVLPEPNKQAFPRAFRNESRLTYYASLFNSLEVNSSFYKVPMAKTVARWAESVPDNFQFTFKLWRDITHNKGFLPEMKDIDRFMEVINHAGNKKGCLLIQLPPSVTVAQVKQLENIIIRTKQGGDWNTAIEFRHPTWYRPDIYSLANEYKTSIVLHDMPASYNMEMNTEAHFVYLRFHGEQGDYKGSYSNEILEKFSQRIKSWINQGKDVYVYFNNTIGNAVENLIALNKYVNS